jgi:hypothetical protein
VFALCHDVRRAWRMTIPVEPTDTDIVICAALTDAQASLRELKALRAQWANVPWEAFSVWGGYVDEVTVEDGEIAADTIVKWYRANAPKQETQP